jgi:hypothetical protein
MDDAEILGQINALVDEEHHLSRSHTGSALSAEELARLHDLETTLDQCWDLLRQRRARRRAGQDPDSASTRPPGVVERYLQ